MPDITAQAPDGSQHVFPDGTDPAIIDRVMKSYITGGAASPNAPSKVAGVPSFGMDVARGMGLDADKIEDLQTDPMGRKHTFMGGLEVGREALQGMGRWMDATLRDPAHVVDPINALASNLTTALGLPDKGSIFDKGAYQHPNLGRLLGAGSMLGLGADKGPESTPLGRGTMQEVMGEGPSKARLLADQHAHALATKQHLSGVADAVHTDAQNAMSQVLAKVDAAKPEGAFNKADIQAKVQDAMGDLVKVPEKMPASVAKILKVEKPTWENLAAQKDVSGLINRLRSGGLGDAEVQEALRGQGFSRGEIESAMQGGGTITSDALTAEQLKQMRSDVGQELGRYGRKGTIGAGLNNVYGVLSRELRRVAAENGVEREWLTANDKYSQYAKDFVNKGTPLRRTLEGNTASSIMEPLTGSTRQQLLDVLQKYRDAGFNIDMDTLGEEMRRYGIAKTVNRLSQPTKMDLLMAGFSPKALAIRQLGPRLMRNPKALDRFAGEGFDVIPSRQVYPSKTAAMKASKGEAPRGNPTSFGESDIEMDLRRGAIGPARSMTEEIREAEGRTAAEAEAKRQAWERKQRERRGEK